jgi:hypothetical protein
MAGHLDHAPQARVANRDGMPGELDERSLSDSPEQLGLVSIHPDASRVPKL